MHLVCEFGIGNIKHFALFLWLLWAAAKRFPTPRRKALRIKFAKLNPHYGDMR